MPEREREREREIDYGFDKEFWHPENGRNFDLFSLMSLRERERERERDERNQ